MAYQPVKFAGGSPFGNSGQKAVRTSTGAMASKPAMNPMKKLFPQKPAMNTALDTQRPGQGSMPGQPSIMPNQGGGIDQLAQMLMGGGGAPQAAPQPLAVQPTVQPAAAGGAGGGVQDLLRRIQAMRSGM